MSANITWSVLGYSLKMVTDISIFWRHTKRAERSAVLYLMGIRREVIARPLSGYIRPNLVLHIEENYFDS